jgi:hypothetical protein
MGFRMEKGAATDNIKHNAVTKRKNDAVLMQLDALTAELYLMGRW